MNDQATGTDLVLTEDKTFSQVPASAGAQRAVFLPTNLAEAMKLAEYMAVGIGVRPWMRGNASACFMVLQQAIRWGMDPYAVANKAYYTNDTLCFEAQLVNAVINTSGELVGRLKIEWAGEFAGLERGKETLVCRVTGTRKSDPENAVSLTQPMCDVTIRNSPLWKTNPKLQLAYHATRSWARLYMPEVLMGVYTPDEVEDGAAALIEAKSTPIGDERAPDRRSFCSSDEPLCSTGEDADVVDAEVEAVEETSGPQVPIEEEADASKAEGAAEVVDAADPGAEGGPVDDAQSAGSDTAGADAVHSDGLRLPLDDEEPIPSTAEEWKTWQADLEREIVNSQSVPSLNATVERHNHIIDAAEEGVRLTIEDKIADRRADLVE